MEDLAWVLDPLWGHDAPERAAGTCPRDEAIAAWEAASGRRFDRAHWTWWRLFAGFQGLAIWIRSSFEVARGRTADPAILFAGLYPYRFHNAQVARLLQELAA
jgi:aminoglycoside phosphotransferase (APT) family kinase protein